jgi:hypothetical protein
LAGQDVTELLHSSVVLGALTAEEKAEVLDHLAAATPSIALDAASYAWSRLAEIVIEDVATNVADALLALDQDDLANRAGRTRYGYVEPTEAAWQLLEGALEPWLDDIARRATLGLPDAALDLAIGTLAGLHSVDGCTNDERLLSWAPDFASEASGSVVRALTRAGLDGDDERLERALDWR